MSEKKWAFTVLVWDIPSDEFHTDDPDVVRRYLDQLERKVMIIFSDDRQTGEPMRITPTSFRKKNWKEEDNG